MTRYLKKSFNDYINLFLIRLTVVVLLSQLQNLFNTAQDVL